MAQSNNSYLLKQQITNLKKQASKRYHSNLRASNNSSALGQATAQSNIYGTDQKIISKDSSVAI